MANNTLTEKDEELVPVEVGSDGKPLKEEAQDTDAKDAEEPDEEEDDGDERLAESQDDGEEEVVSSNRKRRMKRREVRKRARDHADREMRLLREQNDAMARRLAAVEGNALTQNTATLEQRMAEAARETQQAEAILAKAIKAGNGDDAAAALRIRDEARGRIQQLDQARAYLLQAKNRAAAPQPDARVQSLAREWVEANPWYDPTGRDEDSRVAKAVDDGLVREGYDPRNADYWHELTRRVSARLGGAGAKRGASDADDDDAEASPRKKAPPMGNGRQHAPTSTRKEVFVTPERKQAMIDAGVWEDSTLRNRYLKAYQAYDKSSAR